jgi:hypothetical protein
LASGEEGLFAPQGSLRAENSLRDALRSAQGKPALQTSDFVNHFGQSLLVLGRLVAFLDDDALGRRHANAETRAASRFLGNFQSRLLAACHRWNSIADAAG